MKIVQQREVYFCERTQRTVVSGEKLGQCDCGELVNLDRFTNTCDGCGTDYNGSGQRLAPRSQWGCETGESVSDILMADSIRDSEELDDDCCGVW